MKIVLAIVGALLGAAWSEFGGAACGGVLGYIVGELLGIRRALSDLEARITDLQSEKGFQAAVPVVASPSVIPTIDVAAASIEPPAEITSSLSEIAPRSKWKPPLEASPDQEDVSDSSPSYEAGPEPAPFRWIREYFTGGNALVRVGVIILFFGVAFLLKYAAEHTTVPIEFRLLGVAVGAIVLMIMGWRLRTKRADYAFALQGAGVGVLYLTTFAALRLYSLLPPSIAFAVLVAMGVLGAALAILQNSKALAVLGICGGFLAPVLTSTGQGSHVVLFSYYALLNAGILGIAWYKAWRPLNVLGFLFTFVIGTAWGVLKYRPEMFASTEPFLILFFLFYVAIAILFASRQTPDLKGYVDASLVFALPLVAFALQAGMLRGDRYALAASAVAVSAFYLGLASSMWRYSGPRSDGSNRDSSYRPLIESFLALGLVFLTLAVPLALDGQWTSATWAIEGAALVWIGCRQARQLARATGVLLQAAAGLIVLDRALSLAPALPILNGACLGCLIISAAGLVSARFLQRQPTHLKAYETPFITTLFLWAVFWYLLASIGEVNRQIEYAYRPHVLLVVFALGSLTSSVIFRRWQLIMAQWPALALLPLMIFFAAIDMDRVAHPFAVGGFLSWPIAFAVFYWICRRHEDDPGTLRAHVLHVLSFWLLVALIASECTWAIERVIADGISWSLIAPGLVPALVLLALPRLSSFLPWPIDKHRDSYLLMGSAGIAAYLGIWSVGADIQSDGTFEPLYYLPLLNPLDVTHVFAFFAVLAWWFSRARAVARMTARLDLRTIYAAFALILFVWLNAMLLRSLHQWLQIPFHWESLLSSTVVQTALSIFWTLLALVTMLLATQRRTRPIWFVGAGLMVTVVLKLFFLDLSRIGTVERIVSFIAVGLLMLVIGYFSPLPPAAEDKG